MAISYCTIDIDVENEEFEGMRVIGHYVGNTAEVLLRTVETSEQHPSRSYTFGIPEGTEPHVLVCVHLNEDGSVGEPVEILSSFTERMPGVMALEEAEELAELGQHYALLDLPPTENLAGILQTSKLVSGS